LEKVEILYYAKAKQYFNELVFILFQRDYFSYKKSAKVYRDKITAYIKRNITTFPPKNKPDQLHSFGEKYIFYKANQ
jgi:capsule polysaccharide export protein KpsE/RkpR